VFFFVIRSYAVFAIEDAPGALTVLQRHRDSINLILVSAQVEEFEEFLISLVAFSSIPVIGELSVR
jgi:hypothetical protein